MVILYDPVQTANGQLTMKAYRLSKAFMRVYREKKNEVIKPSEILEELPIKIRNPGIINALIFDLQVLLDFFTPVLSFFSLSFQHSYLLLPFFVFSFVLYVAGLPGVLYCSVSSYS